MQRDLCSLFLIRKENNISFKSKQRCWSRWADKYADSQVVTQTGSYTSQQMQAARQTDLQIRRSQTDEGNEFFLCGILLNSCSGIHGILGNAGKSNECRKKTGHRLYAGIHTRERGIPSPAQCSVHLGEISIFILFHGSKFQMGQ